MAKATVVKEVIKVVEPKKVVLELSKEEAIGLYIAVSNTNGNLVLDIYNQLRELGFDTIKCYAIGSLDLYSLEKKLDKFIEVPESLRS